MSQKGVGLKNPEMMEEYLEDVGVYYSTGEHILLSMLMGGVTGSIMGSMIGFYDYESDKQPANERYRSVLLMTGIIGGIGFLTGGLVAVIEYFQYTQFEIGKPILKYTVYTTLIGALLGTLVGLIPYGSNNNIDSILNYMAYGSAAGLASGIILYVLFERFSLKDRFKFNLWYEPFDNKYNVSFSKEISL